ncbi:MAG TPA: T9SS type A sorting domain-containing protein [Flavobacterium sp.]|jgi:hypothetical protein
MKKITLKYLLTLTILFTSLVASAQFGCNSAVALTNGYTATGITTPGNGGPQDWATLPTGTSISASYWDDDVYLFSYTAGATAEQISMTTFTRNSWNGIGIFSSCTGTTFAGELSAAGSSSSSNISQTVSAILNPGQTVYIATGQWGTPNGLDFDVTNFTATPVTEAPACTTVTTPANGATNVNTEGVLSWTAAPLSTGYYVSVGTTSGGTNIVNMADAGNATTYNIPGVLNANTTYYVTVVPYNMVGPATGCTATSFTTGTPPANDDCSGAVTLTVNTDYNCASTASGTLVGATASAVTDNGAGTPDDDVWYSFVATATTHRIMLTNVAGTPTDLVHETLSGTCGALTSVLISDPNTSNPTGLVPGNTYYVRVFSYATGGTPTTTFSVCVGTAPSAPTNDNSNGALALTVNPDLACGTTTNGTTISATPSTEAAPSCNATGINDDVWYTFTATSTAVRFVYSSVTTGTIATALYTGTPGSLTQVAGACASGATQDFTGLTAGTTYYARIFTTVATATTTTNFTVCVGTPPAAPANDNCNGAAAITVNSDLACTAVTSGTTAFSTQSMAATPCTGTPDDDVWFSFVATAATHQVSLTNVNAVEGTSTDMMFQVMSGSCNATTSVLCSDPNLAQVTGLTAGQTYFIRVYTYFATSRATFDICVGTYPAAPANDEPSGALPLTVNADLTCTATANGTTISATPSTEAAPTCSATGVNDDVWYTFTATSSNLRFVYSNVTSGTIATALYTGTPGSLAVVANGCQSGLLQDFTGLTVGTQYYARVYTTASAGTTSTTFTVCVGTLPASPANDLCANAATLVPGGTFADNDQVGTLLAASTTNTGLTYTCQTSRSLDVWYSVVVPASGSITIETNAVTGSSLTDTVLSVFSGSCNSLTQVGCSDDEGTGNFSLVTVTGQTPGSTLLVGVWRFGSGVGGEFQISAYDASLASARFDAAAFVYYPNPVHDILQLSYKNDITDVAVYNLLGQQVIAKKINATTGEVDMSSLAAGTYVIKIRANDEFQTFKVMKD